ncbi:MAG: PilZ domain-containing protein [Fibrobacter sp.]|nr:PilZ domain-containing protein [Fibrobacter sp.]
MILPSQLFWLGAIIIMGLVLLVLVEINRSNLRREHEEMFGTKDFDEKVAANNLTPKEIRTLEKLVRASKFENKDAVLNSSHLFETAVSDFYEIRDVDMVRDETLDAVSRLRQKLGFDASNPLSVIASTRQFNVGNRVDLLLDGVGKLKHSEILSQKEKKWKVAYDGSFGPGSSYEGKEVRIRWTRPEDAVYSANVKVCGSEPGMLVLRHSISLDKQQLRRWLREIVNFPVEAVFADGKTCNGMLYDLSAGGILIGLPIECESGLHIRIRFELPSFGPEDVEIEILRNLGHKNADYPELYSTTASFTGAFGWTQERVLQYIFEVNKQKKAKESAKNALTS